MKRSISLLMTACLCLSLAGCFAKPAEVIPPITELETVPTTEAFVIETEQSTQPNETTTPSVPTEPFETTEPLLWEPEDTDFVAVQDYIPNVQTELKYASADNFTGQIIYEFEDVYLRYGTVKKLISVQQELESMGLSLKIWDGFRPVSAQFKLWEVCPDPTYVANPETGYSSHSRGNTVDITLVDTAGKEVEMPTGFDDFTTLADRDYSDCTGTAAENALLLQNVMEKYGFSGYYGEWWHYSDTVTYPVEECFDPALISTWYADCNEFISLREAPDVTADVITRILVNESLTLLGYDGDFAMVDYRGLRGYVLVSYIKPETK